jgi:hypothetical protein
MLDQHGAGVAVFRIGTYRPCSDIFPIYGWVQKYWTTSLQIKLTDVKFLNFPSPQGAFLQRADVRW